MRHLSISERLGMAEARNLRLETRALRMDAQLQAMGARMAAMESALRAIMQPPQAERETPSPEAHPATRVEFISAARMADITAAVAVLHGLTADDLRGRSSTQRIARPRQEAMLIMREAGYSLSRIARFFGRDHTTVMHGIAAAKARADGVAK